MLEGLEQGVLEPVLLVALHLGLTELILSLVVAEEEELVTLVSLLEEQEPMEMPILLVAPVL